MLCTRSVAETESVGAALGRVLLPGDVVVLTGELGSGKTAFTRGVAAGLGAQDAITSPTFTIMRHHATAGPTLLHLDAYRLDGPDDAEDLGLLELLDEGAIAVIEWGERIVDALGADHLDLRFSWADDDVRCIDVVAAGERWRQQRPELSQVLAAWSAAC